MQQLAGDGFDKRARTWMNARGKLERGELGPPGLKRGAAAGALDDDRPAPGAVWTLVGKHGEARAEAGLGEGGLGGVALAFQDIALGVEHISLLLEFLRGRRDAGDLLPHEHFAPLPATRFGDGHAVSLLERKGAAVGIGARGDFALHGGSERSRRFCVGSSTGGAAGRAASFSSATAGSGCDTDGAAQPRPARRDQPGNQSTDAPLLRGGGLR